MKVFGKFMGGHKGILIADGGYMAIDAQWINVETYTGESVADDDRCLIKLGASYISTQIKNADGSYLSPDMANDLVKEAALTDVLDLDKYNLGFFDVFDVRPESITVVNEIDDNYNPVPLEVVAR